MPKWWVDGLVDRRNGCSGMVGSCNRHNDAMVEWRNGTLAKRCNGEVATW